MYSIDFFAFVKMNAVLLWLEATYVYKKIMMKKLLYVKNQTVIFFSLSMKQWIILIILTQNNFIDLRNMTLKYNMVG